MATEVSTQLLSGLHLEIVERDTNHIMKIEKPETGLIEKEDRIDSPTATEKTAPNVFSLVSMPVPDDSLKEITNLDRPAPLLGVGKLKDTGDDTGDQNSANTSPTVISPSTKATLISAGRSLSNR